MATRTLPDAAAAGDRFEVDGNRLALLPGGRDRLDALLALIQGARRDLRLLYYIFAADDAGARVRDAAIEACRRGIAVRLLIDGFGSEGASADFFAPLVDAGAQLCRFVPRFGRRYLLRNHQKMAIADDGIALVGGFNVADAYFADAGDDRWRDLGLLVDGPAVAHLAGYYDALSDWTHDGSARMRTLVRVVQQHSQADGRLRWVFGGPCKRLSPWAHALKRDLDRGSRLDVVAAYFAPNPGTLRRFGRIARRGGARIVTAAKSDNGMTIAAARHTYARLLRRGARVYEYQPCRLHTKAFVIDDIVYLGSANCDMRSLFLNLEVMLRIEDAALAAAVKRYIDGEARDSREAHRDRLRASAGPLTRLRWSLAYFLVAVADYSVTRRLNLKPGNDGFAT